MLLLLVVGTLIGCNNAFDSHLRGPSFVMEPPSKLEFSNSSGGWLDCSASGNPQPSVDWQSADGTSVGDVAGIRKVLRNGTLVLQPFTAAAYRQDIHNTVYRCVVSNTVGRIVSRDVQIRAVVTQAFRVDVEVIGAPRGCSAVLKCIVPTFAKELVRIISWIQEPTFFIYPSLQGDGKFHQLPSGELLIHNLEFSDQFPTYRCRTMHRLSRQVIVSSPANVRITENRGIVPPVILHHSGMVVVAQDEGAALICIAQGCPPPEYRWYLLSGMESNLMISGPRIRQLASVLAIEAVTPDDGGTYKCTSFNAGGEASAELRLIVSTALHVEVSPPLLSVHMGGTAEFKCLVSAPNEGPHLVTWYKDGRQLPNTGRSSSEALVISNVGREDKGMYQCIIRRAEGDTAQASAELQLGDAPPTLLYSFIEQTLQPGPAVSLKCSASGNPTPQISWTLDGFPLPSHGRFVIGQYVTVHGDVISHVNISHVMVEDGGEYSCSAENRAGRSSHSARLNVYGMPYIRLIPKVTAVAGEILQLKCPVAGYPIEEVHWERGGRDLPGDLRQKVLHDGTLLINPVEKKADSGVYTCWARNKQGQSARRSGEVNVIVPPKVSPFYIEDTLHIGDRASLTCSVTKGDLPLTISWRKNGRNIQPVHMVSITQVDQFTSILVIEKLSSEHNGNYTCVVSNLAAEVSHTHQLVVNVPPRWEVEPIDVSVERNHQVSINCQAKGVPTPTITWKKAIAGKSGDYETLKDHTYTRLLGNGTLVLQHVKEDREGYYLCQAENGIGPVIGKVIQLRVNSPPYFAAPSRLVSVRKGDTAFLKCDVNGDKPINVIWLRDSKYEMNPSSNYRTSVKQDVTAKGVTAELQIASAQSTDSGTYFCQASNMYGKDQQLVQLIVQEPPVSPQNLEATTTSSTSINIKWQHKSEDSDRIFKFIVEYREEESSWKQLDLMDISAPYTAVIEDLKPATAYTVRVIAVGPAGESPPCSELHVRTESQRPSGPPLNISVRPLSSTELIVTWTPPSPEVRHGAIQGFNVGYRTSNMGAFNFTTVMGDAQDGGELVLGDLDKYTRYSIVVQAFNEVGAGPLSEPSAAQTLEDVPTTAPEDVRCASLTSQSLQISWQPPPLEDCNGLLQGYKLTYESVLDDNWKGNDEIETRKTKALTTVITGLKKFTNYSLQVLAFTKVGDGKLSTAILCQTDEDVPGHPEDIKVVVSSSQSLKISWLPPLEPNGIITKYNLYKRSMDGREEVDHIKQTISSQHTSYEVKGVQSHIEYQFWVTASTRIGEGQSSKVVSQVATSQVPARIVSFGVTVVRAWKTSVALGCEAVGAPKREWLHGEVILRSGSSPNQQILNTGELIISNLQPNDMSNYTCQVDNNQGSDRITYKLIVQVPPSAPLLHVTSATSISILLNWKIENDGGAPITGFTLNYRKEHGNLDEVHLSRHSISYELKSLSCGTTYQLYLTAHNMIGSSPASHPLQARTQGHSPGIPNASSFLVPNSTSVLLRLHIWPDNGCTVLYFVLQYRKALSPHWILVSNNLKPQKRTSIIGLSPGTKYFVKVEAHNTAGFSTNELSFTTLTKDGIAAPNVVEPKHIDTSFYFDLKFVLPFTVILIVIIICGMIAVLCLRRRQNGISKELLSGQQCTSLQKERYYATIHKTVLQAGEKIPETSEDISPYATFQLSEPSTLPQNTMLHSLMYHEYPMTEGCASPPPTTSVLRSSPYYNIKFRDSKNYGTQCSSGQKETDTEESESDPEHLTTLRVESSSHLNVNRKLNVRPDTHLTMVTDISPKSEQKSLPRRNRSRLSQQGRSSSQRQIFSRLSITETTFTKKKSLDQNTVDRPELSEAECDIDTIKKIKLGLKSSLWSKPSNSGQATDYSIAV
ncbi:cell adhesion molecule Dscam2 isoform X4 [Zophobas morio]|uniref:cell adhesion molecule Dscam2 isoform X4 n=1 Tax=Zophobas morio TaxID=2755281 RepID=UPI0030833C0C